MVDGIGEREARMMGDPSSIRFLKGQSNRKKEAQRTPNVVIVTWPTVVEIPSLGKLARSERPGR